MDVIRNLKEAIEVIKITLLKKYRGKSGNLIGLSQIIEESVAESYLHDGSSIDIKEEDREKYDTEISITKETTTDAIIRLNNKGDNVYALNFANPTTPGGGFLVGHSAQEESIFRNSIIIPSILANRKMYAINKSNVNDYIYTDYMIISKNVPVIRDNNRELLDLPVVTSFITSPAVFAKKARKKRVTESEIRTAMRNRIDKILNISYREKADTLVLGCFGCGEFENYALDIGLIFKDLIEDKYRGVFKEIVFAIYSSKDSENLDIFQKMF